jgi:glucose-6-phosphate isomerase
MSFYINAQFEEGLFSKDLEYWVPHEASAPDLEKMAAKFDAWTRVPANSDGIFSGYRRQILEAEGLKESVEKAELYRGRFKTLVVLGIGGSALGTKALLQSLSHTRTDPRRVEVLDNLDPVEFERIWSSLNPKETFFTVISKSGGTLETMAQTSLIVARLQATGLRVEDHLLAITDPKSGVLRQWVKESHMDSLEVPSDVGGRFSVFTPVGLFPLAFAGLNVEALIKGAQRVFRGELIDQKQLLRLGHRLAEFEWEGFAGHVLMPYATVLKDFSAWFVQLWGESLGKETSKGSRVGSIPVAAVGATDQHSILQLLVEGPNRIITGFVSVRDWNLKSAENVKMTSSLPSEHFKSLSYAEGASFARILEAQSKATQSVLIGRQRPTYRIELGRLDEEHLGALMAFYMDLTTATGTALDINPYDQPGVEEGKVILPSFLTNP